MAGDRTVGLGEGLEDALALCLGDADAGVGDRDGKSLTDLPGRRGGGPQGNLAAGRELDGVADKIEENLPDLSGIALEPCRDVRRHDEFERQTLLLGRWPHQRDDAGQRFVEPEHHRVDRNLARLDLRVIQDAVENAHQRLARG